MKLKELPLHSDWLDSLTPFFDNAKMLELEQFLNTRRQAGAIVYPSQEEIFKALNATPLHQVRVVILGQDPYHGEAQAHGLSFSVPHGQAIPPSLKNIYTELVSDVGFKLPSHGNLSSWAQQGVLLLNSVLTVEQGQAGSHQKQGWELFSDQVISLINSQCDSVVFLLWGAYAHKKGANIDQSRHLVLKAPHPSPLSCYRGFYGCRHFSQANTYLTSNGHAAIEWQIE